MIPEISYRRDLHRLLTYFGLPKVVAEIGVAEGLNSRDMLEWGIDTIYCVDNWAHIKGQKGDANQDDAWHEKNFEKARRLLRPFYMQGKVIWLKGLSKIMRKNVSDNALGLLYLDGDHSVEAVTEDIYGWWSKVVPGGIIAGHDYENPAYGVKEAVNNFCNGRFEVHLLPEDKAEDAGFWFRKTP